MDDTGVMLSMLGSVKVLVQKDDVRDYRGARAKRTTGTAIECISADGRYLKPMIIWPAATHRSNWTTFPTPEWHYACSESGYTDSKISLEWLKRMFDTQTKEMANHKPRVLICDGFGTYETLEALEYCFANNIILCRLPSRTSHKLQPCDVAVFAPLKAAYRENVERLERGALQGKEHSPGGTSSQDGAKVDCSPFNPDRVLKDLPKPLPGLLGADGVTAEPAMHDAGLTVAPATSATPATPVTPVSVEALMSLQNVIVTHDAQLLDQCGKHRLQNHVQKLTKAAQTFLAKNALQREQIHFLLRTNNEAKVRRSTKSLVLGKARVVSYEDLKQARVERVKKDNARASRKKEVRGRQCKSNAPEADSPQSDTKAAPISDAPEPASAPMIVVEPHVREEAPLSEPQRAPVAQMW